MIFISNSPVDAGSISNDYPNNSVERVIIDKLSSSEEKYYYNSLNELKFELRLRRKIIQASKDLYKSKFDFEVFRDARCNTDYWELTNEGGFKLKNGVKPSDAVNDIYKNSSKYATECATAMVIVYLKALLSIFPTELYDKMFQNLQLMNWHYLNNNIKEVGYTRKAKDYLPGDRRYFANPDVNPLTPEWQGENTIDLDNGLYYGHGLGIYTADAIIKELNENRKEGAVKSAYLLDSAGRPNFKRLADIYYNNVQ